MGSLAPGVKNARLAPRHAGTKGTKLATSTGRKRSGKTPTEQRAATNPAWVFALSGMTLPVPMLILYAVRQRCWSYMNVAIVMFAILFIGSDAEGSIDKKFKYATQIGGGAVAALIASNNKKKAFFL